MSMYDGVYSFQATLEDFRRRIAGGLTAPPPAPTCDVAVMTYGFNAEDWLDKLDRLRPIYDVIDNATRHHKRVDDVESPRQATGLRAKTLVVFASRADSELRLMLGDAVRRDLRVILVPLGCEELTPASLRKVFNKKTTAWGHQAFGMTGTYLRMKCGKATVFVWQPKRWSYDELAHTRFAFGTLWVFKPSQLPVDYDTGAVYLPPDDEVFPFQITLAGDSAEKPKRADGQPYDAYFDKLRQWQEANCFRFGDIDLRYFDALRSDPGMFWYGEYGDRFWAWLDHPINQRILRERYRDRAAEDWKHFGEEGDSTGYWRPLSRQQFLRRNSTQVIAVTDTDETRHVVVPPSAEEYVYAGTDYSGSRLLVDLPTFSRPMLELPDGRLVPTNRKRQAMADDDPSPRQWNTNRFLLDPDAADSGDAGSDHFTDDDSAPKGRHRQGGEALYEFRDHLICDEDVPEQRDFVPPKPIDPLPCSAEEVLAREQQRYVSRLMAADVYRRQRGEQVRLELVELVSRYKKRATRIKRLRKNNPMREQRLEFLRQQFVEHRRRLREELTDLEREIRHAPPIYTEPPAWLKKKTARTAETNAWRLAMDILWRLETFKPGDVYDKDKETWRPETYDEATEKLQSVCDQLSLDAKRWLSERRRYRGKVFAHTTTTPAQLLRQEMKNMPQLLRSRIERQQLGVVGTAYGAYKGLVAYRQHFQAKRHDARQNRRIKDWDDAEQVDAAASRGDRTPRPSTAFASTLDPKRIVAKASMMDVLRQTKRDAAERLARHFGLAKDDLDKDRLARLLADRISRDARVLKLAATKTPALLLRAKELEPDAFDVSADAAKLIFDRLFTKTAT